MATTYFDIEDGTCLLRRERTDGALSFEVMDTKGVWRDGTDLGVRYTVSMSEIGAEEISEPAANSLAEKLGGKL